MTSSATSPEQLDTMLEDACLLRDRTAVAGLFKPDSVLQFSNQRRRKRGPENIADLMLDAAADGVVYLARPPTVLQSGRLALIVAGRNVHVVRHGHAGWRYLISFVDGAKQQ